MLYGFHKVASNVNEAVKMALMAGTDLEASSDCYANIPAMVRLGELDVKYVDLACSRVLYAKFKAGLFETLMDSYRRIRKKGAYKGECCFVSQDIGRECGNG